MVKAWNSGDLEAIRALYTNDIVHHDATFYTNLAGIDAVMEMASEYVHSNPAANRQITNRFIGSEDSLAVFSMSGFQLGGYEFTQDDPALVSYRLKTRGNLISYWTMYYGLDFMEKAEIRSKILLDLTRSFLSSYASAWSSGDPGMVGKLYAGNAVRRDTILGEFQQGSEAIISFEGSFFGEHPGVQWTLLQAFGEGQGWQGEPPVIGGIFAIDSTGPTSQPCKVLAAVLMQTSEGSIIHETLYYDPDSLISCGWVR